MGFVAFIAGLAIYLFIRVFLRGLYTVRPDERAALTSFGAAQKLENRAWTRSFRKMKGNATSSLKYG